MNVAEESESWFCFSGDFLFLAFLKGLLGIIFFSRLLKQIQGVLKAFDPHRCEFKRPIIPATTCCLAAPKIVKNDPTGAFLLECKSFVWKFPFRKCPKHSLASSEGVLLLFFFLRKSFSPPQGPQFWGTSFHIFPYASMFPFILPYIPFKVSFS